MKNSLTDKIADYCSYVSRAVRYYRDEAYADSASNCRKAAEASCKIIIFNAYSQKSAESKLEGKSLKELILLLIQEGLVSRKVINMLETLQITGNKAAHDNPVGKEETIYAINALSLFNEYLFKEHLKIHMPQNLDLSIVKAEEKVIHKEIIRETIVREKLNKQAEEQILSKIKEIESKSQDEAQRFDELKKEINLSRQKIIELSKNKEQLTDPPQTAPQKERSSKRKNVALVLALAIVVAGVYFFYSLLHQKEISPALAINKHPDSLYIAINTFQVMQDNPNQDFDIAHKLFVRLDHLRSVYQLPLALVQTNYPGTGDPYDSLLVDKAEAGGFDLVYYGNLYETARADSNVLEIRGCATQKNNRIMRNYSIKFITLADSTFIKEINDQTNFPVVLHAMKMEKNPSRKLVATLESLRCYSLENYLSVTNAKVILKSALKDYKGTLAGVDILLRYLPASAYNYTYKANVLGYLNQMDSAKIYFEKAYRLDSANAFTLLNYAKMLYALKNFEGCEVMALKALKVSPREYSMFTLLASIKWMQNQRDLSKKYALQAHYLFPDDPENLLILANVYGFHENKKDSAEYFYRRALGNDSTNIDALTNLVTYYQRFCGLDPVYKLKITYLLDKLQDLKVQNDMRAEYSFGIAAYDSRDYRKSLEYFEKVFDRGGIHSELLTCMAQAYYFTGQSAKALDFSEKAVQFDSLASNNQLIRAYLYSYLTPKEHKKCISYFNKALQLDPGSLDLHQMYGVYLGGQHKVKECIDLALKGLKLFPDDLRLNSLAAYGYFELKKYKQAKPFFETLVRQRPNNDTLLSDLSQCILLNFNGPPDESAVYGANLINRALQINPGAPAYYLIYALYFSKGGNVELAVKNYRIAKELSKNSISHPDLEKLMSKGN